MGKKKKKLCYSVVLSSTCECLYQRQNRYPPNLTAYCAFSLQDHVTTSPATGETITVPSVLNGDSFVGYDDITEEMVVSWVDDHLPADTVSIYREIILKKIQNTYQPKSSLPWQ